MIQSKNGEEEKQFRCSLQFRFIHLMVIIERTLSLFVFKKRTEKNITGRRESVS